MTRKAILVAVVLSLLLGLASPVAVSAQNAITIVNSSARIQFPLALVFNMTARGDAAITDVRLQYWVEQRHFAEVRSEAFVETQPSTTVNASWTWDMRRTGGMPPGAVVNYRWIVTDTRGNRVESAPSRINFDDTRYTWRKVVENRVTLYWYQGNDAFAAELMAAAQQGLARLERDTGARLEQPVSLYIYASSRDLQGAMVFPQEWTGGAAYSGYGIIVIGIPTNSLDWGKRTITHELTHLVIDQMTSNPYNSPPVWVQEGLAMYNEGPLEAQFQAPLRQAILNNKFISVRSLSSPFSAFGDQSVLSYAESESVIEYLITKYGQGKMFEFLSAFKEGSTFDGAVQKVYGFDMDGLYNEWRIALTGKTPTPAPRPSAAPAGISLLLVAGTASGNGVLAVLILFIRRTHGRTASEEIVHHP